MGTVYAISGIDTDAGKTIATGVIASAFLRLGKSIITAKLVQTGNIGFSEDLMDHRYLMGTVDEPYVFAEDAEKLTTPQIFAFPASPHLAAQHEGREIDLAHIVSCVNTLAERYDIVLLECAGGLAVPLTEDLLTIDFIAQNNWEVILVTSGKLGSVNHTLLSLEAIKARNLSLRGMLYNEFPPADPIINADTPRIIRRYLEKAGYPQVLVSIPKIEEGIDGLITCRSLDPAPFTQLLKETP